MKILIAGDFCPQSRAAKLLDTDKYYLLLAEVCEYTKQADFSIVNLEAPVEETDAQPIAKYGPNLKCSSNSIKALKHSGFNLVTLANNHFYDYGDQGVKQTLEACRNHGLETVGGGLNLTEASNIFYKEIKGKRLAIINCCENEFSIATDASGGSNPLDIIKQYYAIQEARSNADVVIVIIHGGHEGYQLPSPRMVANYRFFVDAGADVVINHHQHCFSGYEVYKDKPIFYGLGNFSFDRDDKRNNIWNNGYMVLLNINNNCLSFNTIPYTQGNKDVAISILKNTATFDLDIQKFNHIISDKNLLRKEHEKWMEKTSLGYLLALEPYDGKILSALYFRKFLPSFLTARKCCKIIDYINCEAHLDRLRFMIKKRIK